MYKHNIFSAGSREGGLKYGALAPGAILYGGTQNVKIFTLFVGSRFPIYEN